MGEQIDYSRWQEFLTAKGHVRIAPSRADEKLRQDYVRWLKQQQKPAHLDFEVKR